MAARETHFKVGPSSAGKLCCNRCGRLMREGERARVVVEHGQATYLHAGSECPQEPARGGDPSRRVIQGSRP